MTEKLRKISLLKKILVAGFLAILFSATSCIFVKAPDAEEIVFDEILSPKPEIAMSNKLVRSEKGDMIALLPKDWFFVNPSEKLSVDVFSIASNPEYTMTLLFSHIRGTEIVVDAYESDGLLGAARLSLQKHIRKTAGAVKQIGKYQNLKLGPYEYIKFEISTTSGALTTHSAVFRSNIGNFYQVSLVPINITGRSVPSKLETAKIFRSVLATVKY